MSQVTETIDFRTLDTREIELHISVSLRSNSGNVPLRNRKFTLHVRDEVIEGETDDEGLIETKPLPPGDPRLDVDGRSTFIPTVPPEITRVVHRVSGYTVDLMFAEGS